MTTSVQADPQRAAAELTGRLEAHIQMRADEISGALPRADRTEDVAKFLAKVRNATANTIRQAPAAAQRALAYTQNSDVSITQLVRVIEEDPTLTQALLKHANSAYYATGGRAVVSLTQAAQRIGSSGVHTVVIGHMVHGMLCRPGGEYQRMADLVHTHMVRTAGLARALARRFQVPPDEAFVLGLLHDVGKLVIFDTIGSLRHQRRREVVIPTHIVLSTLTAVHEAFGGLAAIRWNLGVNAARAIATHHRLLVPAEHDRVSELLFLAERGDHVLQGLRAMEVEKWWTDGGMTGPWDWVEEMLSLYKDGW